MLERCRREAIAVFVLTAVPTLITRVRTASYSFINSDIYSSISYFLLHPIHILKKNGYALLRMERCRYIRNSHKGTGHAYGRLITV
ncbi:hypothetical protein ROA7450_03062 [Roseovarius albus]|uniref:Uncharacterized protein n=1 Tax=Roseovarius albus TaxID=1247867 RepID=A0A1X6ZTL2_9RHOB|nr:hypothetical protein ROA7450_03062 [Roseovarius albus]